MTESKRLRQLSGAWQKLTRKQGTGFAFEGFLDALETRGEAPVSENSTDLLATWPFCLAGQVPFSCYSLLLHILSRPGARIRVDARGIPMKDELAYFEHAGLSAEEVRHGVALLHSDGILSEQVLGIQGVTECGWLRVRHPEECVSN